MSKFWKKNKTIISGVLLAVIGITAFVGLGYYYSKTEVGYDFVGVGSQVDSLNYNTGNGNMYKITTIMNEGLITPTIDVQTLQSSINDSLTGEGEYEGEEPIENYITDNNLASIDEYFIASKVVLADYAEDYLNTKEKFDTLNENEKTLVILASSDYNEGNIYDQTAGENLTYAARILTHSRPITYIGDDIGETYDVPEWVVKPDSGNSYWQYAYGASELIYTNQEYTEFRFRMRDGSLEHEAMPWDDVSYWQTWYDDGTERKDRVSAADVAFGISRQAPAMYGSSGRYMYTSVSDLVGSDEIVEADRKYGIEEEGRYIVEEGETPQEKAMYYALPPESEVRKKAFDEDQDFIDFGTRTTPVGVVFHDPKGFEDSAVEQGSDDYSYIDFTLNSGDKKFPTMMSSTSFWPMNWEWFENEVWTGKISDESSIDAMNKFGTSADTILSNGAQQVTKFDNLYGYTTEKNPNYYDSDLVTAEKTSYRMITEPSTQVSMFDNGDATYVTGNDSNVKVINDDPDASKWLKDKLTKPATTFMFFNLGTDRLNYDDTAATAKYTSDPNFRRAFTYLFDTNSYHQFSSINTANAVSTFEPLGMYSAYGRDLADHMKDTTFTNKGTENVDSIDSEQLEYFNTEDRKEVVENPIDFNTVQDPTRHEDLADYYFQEFLNDMELLGVDDIGVLDKSTDTYVITLKYLTSVGANDAFVKTIQQEISSHTFIGDDGKKYRIELNIEQVPQGSFFDYYYAADYDLASIQWGPDYLDAWSNIGIFNISENSRGGNSTAGWNIWDGSDYTFDDSVYGEENTQLARDLFNDGMVQFYENGGENANIQSIEYVSSVDPSNTYSTQDFINVSNLLWNSVLSDNDIENWSEGVAVANTNNEQNPTYGLNYYGHTEDIWSDQELDLASNLIFELLLKDGASTVTGTTESGSISPSRALLEGDPVVGYETRTFAFDLTRTKGFWQDVDKQLKEEFYKN